MLPDFTLLDYVAVGWFFVCWIGYALLVDHSRWYKRSVSGHMHQHRRRWMRNMILREMRMVDTQIHASLVNGILFFASTSILLVGGLLTVLGATDAVISVMSDLPLGAPVSRTAWEIKIVLLILIFVYAFFKFAWCYRLSSNCSIMVGAAPRDVKLNAEAEDFADRIAHLYSLSGRHFHRGLRAYFFALAAFCWLVNPVLFIIASTWVLAVLIRREFCSQAFDIIKTDEVKPRKQK